MTLLHADQAENINDKVLKYMVAQMSLDVGDNCYTVILHIWVWLSSMSYPHKQRIYNLCSGRKMVKLKML